MICKNCIHYNVCEYSTIADKEVDCKDFISNTIKSDIVRKMQEKIRSKSEYGTINISPWQLDQIAKEVLEENK